MNPTRRTLLGGLAAGGALTVTGAVPAQASPPLVESPVVRPGDPQYPDLARGINQRFVGRPAEVHVAGGTGDVAAAVRRAVRTGRRPAVRSGGHCFEDFVAGPDVDLVVDLSGMDRVTWDAARGAFAVEAGARLENVYERLFKSWGVTIPGGSCPTVGVGGHFAGGGYGPLNRMFGLTVDHLDAVEVVVAGPDGDVRTVRATRAAGDPANDLWWAHTGGGGGNFGVVTRYWLRTPGTPAVPRHALPTPPSEVLVATVIWPWPALDRDAFVRLLRNYGGWYAAHNAPGGPGTEVYSHLATFHASGGAVALNVQVAAGAGADATLDGFLRAVGEGVPAFTVTERRRLPWLLATRWSGFADRPSGRRIKGKSAVHRAALTDGQAQALHRALTRPDYQHPGSGVLIAPHGGRVNAVASDATADPHRDGVLMLLYVSEWTDAAQDATHIAFLRNLYRDVYAESGGVPVSGGALINYADVDLRDPAWNTSGVAWHELYYRANYPRLQRAKRRWDPTGTFRHALGVDSGGPR
ncbi:FAD-linked oxidase [Virgisporangium aliadipatigenens]|uniref:FAD-linked oxidase n=1 Tax=Virgisporangium aliadipatigenens TaxID=741659 RepID=A0A8J4DVQ5_9ACTN|nr:FAD-binding protein [Virgisporangium aliadipatigenens]GIJ50367.1 FAD-linked oxidase [Virgisporangium aliadipatigenens]